MDTLEVTDTDLELIVMGAEEPVEPCNWGACTRQATRFILFTCGHQYNYCDGHAKEASQWSKAGALTCASGGDGNIYIVAEGPL